MTTPYKLPITTCLGIANRKLMDSAYIRARQPGRAADADALVQDAREALQIAAEQNWPGDIERTITDFLASPSCDFS